MSSSKRGAALGAAMCALLCANASATQFSVDKTSDDAGGGACGVPVGDCSLRSAIQQANTNAGHDDIVLGATTYHVASPQEAITTDTAITGAGARSTVIDGDGVGNSLLIVNPTTDHVTISDVTIRGAGGGSFNPAVMVNNGQGTTLARVAIVDNALTGLIVNRGNVQLLSSLVARNTGPVVGGISNQSAGEGFTLIEDSTIAQNTGEKSSPAIPLAFTAGVANNGTLTILNSTIAGNRFAPGVIPLGGENFTNVVTSGSTMNQSRLLNTIVADATAFGNCGGSIESGGHNLDSDGTCGFGVPSDRIGVDPLLGALANNGGPTDTRALLEGSPAIDAGGACSATDQRGVTRPAGGGCDIGAFESPFTAPVPVPPTPAPPTQTPTQTPPGTTADTTPAKLTVTGVGKTVKRAKLNKGLKVKIGADEPISAELILLATPRKVVIAKLPVVALASASLSKAGGTRTVTLKPSAKVKGKRKVKMQLRVVAFDGAGNRSAKTVSFTVT
jgi:hypothetical protein